MTYEEQLLKIFDDFWEKEVNNVIELKDHEQYGAMNRRLLKVFFRKMMQEVRSGTIGEIEDKLPKFKQVVFEEKYIDPTYNKGFNQALTEVKLVIQKLDLQSKQEVEK